MFLLFLRWQLKKLGWFFSMFGVFIRLGKDLQKAARGLVLEMSEAGKIVLIFVENSTHQ